MPGWRSSPTGSSLAASSASPHSKKVGRRLGSTVSIMDNLFGEFRHRYLYGINTSTYSTSYREETDVFSMVSKQAEKRNIYAEHDM
jgi:hypothetical protein